MGAKPDTTEKYKEKLPLSERSAWSLAEWASLRGLSRSGAYEARLRGETPDEVRVGRRVLITREADAAWESRLRKAMTDRAKPGRAA